MTITERDLETMIDRHSLNYILDLLAVVCFEKAEHISEIWQDKLLAKQWRAAGERLNQLAMKVIV